MDLSYSPKHNFFRLEVSDVFASIVHFYPKPFGVNHSTKNARTITKQYRGFGAEPDILKSLITVEEFGRFKAPKGLVSLGIRCLFRCSLKWVVNSRNDSGSRRLGGEK